jgi:hypothetical protein
MLEQFTYHCQCLHHYYNSGEDFLPILRDAQNRLLTPDAKVIPARAKVYAQLVESETLHSWQYLKGDAIGCRYALDCDWSAV